MIAIVLFLIRWGWYIFRVEPISRHDANGVLYYFGMKPGQAVPPKFDHDARNRARSLAIHLPIFVGEIIHNLEQLAQDAISRLSVTFATVP